MKKVNSNKWIGALFVIIIGVNMFLTVGGIIKKAIHKIEQSVSYEVLTKTNVDENMNTNVMVIEKDKKDVTRFQNKIENIITTVETQYTNNFAAKKVFIDINGGFQRLLNKKVISDMERQFDVIKDQSGFLTFGLFAEMPEINYPMENIYELNEFCKSKNIRFLYVNTPHKITGEEEQLPRGIETHLNEVREQLDTRFSKERISYLDLSKELKSENIKYQDIFFRTDHHWNSKGGFWAYQKILQYLSSNFGFDIEKDNEYTSLNNYSEHVYENIFLGTQGRRVGKFFSDGNDDFSLYIPKFETSLKYQQIDKGNLTKEREGTFYQALIEEKHLTDEELNYENIYSSYLDGDRDEIRIYNHNINNDYKILIIKDSFALPVATYLSLNFKETRLLDLRQHDESVYEYIEEYSPDVVIVLYNPSILESRQEMFDFTGEALAITIQK